MVTFSEYILEYTKDKEKSLFFGIAKMKHGNNGKDWNRAHERKHVNTVTKVYNHKHPLVDSVIQGKTNNVPLNNIQLSQILKAYNTEFDGKPKTLGNSGAEIVSLPNNPGVILRKKVN